MTAKEFLMMGWKIEKRIDARIAERERIMDRMTAVRKSTPSATGARGGRRRDWTDAVAALEDVDARLNREIAELCRIKRMIAEAIDAVEIISQRRVLEMRYRNYMTWEQIAVNMPCDIRTVYRLHGRALTRVRVPEQSAIVCHAGYVQ